MKPCQDFTKPSQRVNRNRQVSREIGKLPVISMGQREICVLYLLFVCCLFVYLQVLVKFLVEGRSDALVPYSLPCVEVK